MIRKRRARRIGKVSAYRADKELRLDQRFQLWVNRVILSLRRLLDDSVGALLKHIDGGKMTVKPIGNVPISIESRGLNGRRNKSI
jgi:hypothetical protein